MALQIENYAVVGDTETVAVVGNNGSIDWLCLPRFDSAACFAALLGDESNGRWQIAPVDEVARVERQYRPGTLILETTFETARARSVSLTSCHRVMRIRTSSALSKAYADVFRCGWI